MPPSKPPRKPGTTDDDENGVRGRVHALLSDTRGQTLNDYALGMTFFLTTVLFIFAFINGMSTPYQASGDEGEDIRAERTALRLMQDILVESPYGHEPTTLDTECTTGFFANESRPECSYTPAPLSASFALPPGDSLYIEITDLNRDPVSVNGVTLTRGVEPPQMTSATVDERVVSLNGETYYLRVVVK